VNAALGRELHAGVNKLPYTPIPQARQDALVLQNLAITTFGGTAAGVAANQVSPHVGQLGGTAASLATEQIGPQMGQLLHLFQQLVAVLNR
jgi:hypothetical protein